jgi:ribosomal protein S18 acetylase RimI-like enzyme
VRELEHAVEFMRGFDERRVERIVPAAHGRALLTPSQPLVYHRNHFSVDLGAEASTEQLIQEADPAFAEAGIAHRKITIDDDLGERVAPDFRALGWKAQELLVMTYRGGGAEVDTSIVEEVDPTELEPLWIEGMRSEIENEEEIRQLVAAQHGRRQALEVRYFAARVDGVIASYCELFLGAGTGQIESVMTLERYRGRGLAKAVVRRTLEDSLAAGSDLNFIVAAADDWPKELYRKLGFESVGSVWDFLLTRRPS